MGEFGFVDGSPDAITNGYRRVLIGPAHPNFANGMPMDFPSCNYGQNDLFFQARAFLEQVAGFTRLPPSPSFRDGLRNLRLIAATVQSAQSGAEVRVH